MLSAIGCATARQLRASSARSVRRLAVPATRRQTIVLPILSRNGVAIFQRSFAQSQARPAEHGAVKPKKTATKRAAKKKPTAKPKTPKPRAKKELTPKQKEAAEARQKREAKREAKRKIQEKKDQVKRLMALSLIKEEPKHQSSTSMWVEFLAGKIKGTTGGLGATQALFKEAAAEFPNLPEAEKERLAVKAAQSKTSTQAAYRAWVASKTPVEIFNANAARIKLRTAAGIRPKKIEDDRLPKRAPSAYALFTKSRWASGDLTGTPQHNLQRLVEEWKLLSEEDRKPFHDLSLQLKADYQRQAKLLGLPVQETYFVKSEE